VANHPAPGSPNGELVRQYGNPQCAVWEIRDSGNVLGTAYSIRQVQLALKYIF
jgi:hypothetical protein